MRGIPRLPWKTPRQSSYINIGCYLHQSVSRLASSVNNGHTCCRMYYYPRFNTPPPFLQLPDFNISINQTAAIFDNSSSFSRYLVIIPYCKWYRTIKIIQSICWIVFRMKLLYNNYSSDDDQRQEMTREALAFFLPLFFIIIPSLFILAVYTIIPMVFHCYHCSTTLNHRQAEDHHHQQRDVYVEIALSIIVL